MLTESNIALYHSLVEDIVGKRLLTLPSLKEGDDQNCWINKSLNELLPADAYLRTLTDDEQDVIDRIMAHQAVAASISMPDIYVEWTAKELHCFFDINNLIAIESTYAYKIGTYLAQINYWTDGKDARQIQLDAQLVDNP